MFVKLSLFNLHVIMAAHNRNVFSPEQLKWSREGLKPPPQGASSNGSAFLCENTVFNIYSPG